MLFHSTNGNINDVTLPAAVVNGLAADGGLFMPCKLPPLPKAFYNNISEMSLTEIGYVVCNTLMGDFLSSEKIKMLVNSALDFPVPVKKFGSREGLYVMEMFHGPTLSFKDVGARFMARLLPLLVPGRKKFTILLATSGDSGGALAAAFSDNPDAKVVILYPRGELSREHLSMFTSYPRVTAVEVGGTFDDCQALVKHALLDPSLNDAVPLTSGNSINLARQLTSVIYYFHAYARAMELRPDVKDVVIAVPCGNLGNLSAALMAKKMGLPVSRIVGANNANDTFVEYLQTGDIRPRRALITMARAMDVGNPSNLARIIDLYGDNLDELRHDVEGKAFSDIEIVRAIRDIYAETGEILDPQSATAFRALDGYGNGSQTAIFLATGHPAKFPRAITEAIGSPVMMPHDGHFSGEHHMRRQPEAQGASMHMIPPTAAALTRIITTLK